MLHDLPSDPLAAWFYKNDEGSVEVNVSGMKQMRNDTGASLCNVQSCIVPLCTAACTWTDLTHHPQSGHAHSSLTCCFAVCAALGL